MSGLPYAEDVNYWRTGHSSPEVWLDRARRQIENIKGVVEHRAFGEDIATGHAAYMMDFTFEGDKFRLAWTVLESKSGNRLAALTQAATLLYHDVVAKCVTARVLGTRAAFFTYLLLPGGRSALSVSAPELLASLPAMLTAGRASMEVPE